MSKNPLLTATVISTGATVEIYRNKDGDFVLYFDCKTIFKETELSNIKLKT